MMEKLFNHPTWLKIFSLVLAVMLWLYVMPTYMEETSRQFEVPLTIIRSTNPSLVWLEEDNQPSTVTVKVEGRDYSLRQLTRDDFRATLDLSQVSDADIGKTLPIEVKVAPVRTRRNPPQPTVTPKTIPVTMVEVRSMSMPVQLQQDTGVVKSGGGDWQYTARSDAANVNLTGRSDYLAQVKSVVATVNSADLNPQVAVLQLSPQPLDSQGKPVPKVTAEKVTVRFQWAQLPPGKTLRVQPNMRGTLPPGLSLAKVEPNVTAVDVRAATLDTKLPAQDFIETQPIDLTGHTRTFTATVKLIVPPGVTLPAGVDSVSVKVNIDEVSTEKTFKGVVLTPRGAPSGAGVTLAVTDVQVTFKGPYAVVSKIDPATLSAFVDLEGIGPGKHTLPIKVVLPEGVTELVGADPPTVEVTITLP